MENRIDYAVHRIKREVAASYDDDESDNDDVEENDLDEAE